MSSRKQRIVKATALGLVLAVAHVSLSSGLARASSSGLLAGAARQAPAEGRLVTRGNNAVTVNGNSAKTGETIFSGQTIQTPEGVGATVNLPGQGRVDIAPNTNLSLTFGDGKITVTLVSGCAILTANKGTVGTLESGGTTRRTEGDEGGTLDACTSKTPGAPPIFGQGAASAAGAGAGGATGAAGTAAATTTASGGLFGLGTAGTIGFLGAAGMITAAAVIAVPCRRGRNPSPGVPRGRNDECRD